jgi:hypothetical protein
LNPKLARQAVDFVQRLRQTDMQGPQSARPWMGQRPGRPQRRTLDKTTLRIPCPLLKHESDLQKARRYTLRLQPRCGPRIFGRFSGN